MPQPIATWNPARGVWETSKRSLLCGHSVPYSETWPPSGMTHAGVAYELATWEHRTSGSGSLSLLPTPTAGVFNDGEDVENWLARCEAHKAKGSKVSMSLSVAVALLSTLQATNGTKSGPNQCGSSGDLMLPSAIATLSTGDSTNPQSDAGNTSSGAPHQHPTSPGREATHA